MVGRTRCSWSIRHSNWWTKENVDLRQCFVSTDSIRRSTRSTFLFLRIFRKKKNEIRSNFRNGRKIISFGHQKERIWRHFTNKALRFGVEKNSNKFNGSLRIWRREKVSTFFDFSFAHRGVNYIDFSPNERYLVTLSPRPNNPEAFIIWDVITGQKKRSFPLESNSDKGSTYFKFVRIVFRF